MAFAHKGALFLFDLGYFKIQALARIADAGASVFSRLKHPTTILPMAAGPLHPLELAAFLPTVAGACLETPIFLGAKERVACRLLASRVPESMGNERRRKANKKAQKKG